MPQFTRSVVTSSIPFSAIPSSLEGSILHDAFVSIDKENANIFSQDTDNNVLTAAATACSLSNKIKALFVTMVFCYKITFIDAR